MNYSSDIATKQTFKKFLFNNRKNRITLYLAAIAIIIQFGIFKYLYPFASYIHGDSFSYLQAADKNLTINTYMIGYSKFLRLFSIFAKPDYVLNAFQYLLIQSSVLFLLFTIFYFYKSGKVIQIVLLCFMVFNPLFLHLANMISSDGFFLSLSCIWFGLLLWIIHSPSSKIIILHAIVLFITFTVRYNAMIYPFIAGIAFWLSQLPLRRKIIGFSLGIVLCGLFVSFTMWRYKILTGYWQYSPFSGWQIANNAMYAYRYVDSTEWDPAPGKYQALDNRIRTFFKLHRKTVLPPHEKEQTSTYFMWSPGMPLMAYRDSLFKKQDPKAIELKKWASMGPFYKEYGMYLIKHYPFHFLAHFIWPNSQKYYAPPVEFLDEYNSGKSYVTDQAKAWFGYKTTKVKTRMGDNQVWVLDFYPILSGIINVVMLFGLIYYILLKGWQYNKIYNKTLLLAGIIWVMNAVFTITASSAALRFQSFPIILTTIFTLFQIDWMIQLMINIKKEEKQLTIGKNSVQEAIA